MVQRGEADCLTLYFHVTSRLSSSFEMFDIHLTVCNKVKLQSK